MVEGQASSKLLELGRDGSCRETSLERNLIGWRGGSQQWTSKTNRDQE